MRDASRGASRELVALTAVTYVAALLCLAVLVTPEMWHEIFPSLGSGGDPDDSMTVGRSLVALAVAAGPVVLAWRWHHPWRQLLLTVVIWFGAGLTWVGVRDSCHGDGSGAFPEPGPALALYGGVFTLVYAGFALVAVRRNRPWIWVVGVVVAYAVALAVNRLVYSDAGTCDWDI